MTIRPLILAAILAGIVSPISAFEPLTFGDLSLTLGASLNLVATRNTETTSYGYCYLESTLVWSRQIGDLTYGAELYASAEYGSNAVGRNFYVIDDPFFDASFWVEGDDFGDLAFYYSGSVSSENCVGAPSTGDNFGHADYVSIGTSPSIDTWSVRYYNTPTFAIAFE